MCYLKFMSNVPQTAAFLFQRILAAASRRHRSASDQRRESGTATSADRQSWSHNRINYTGRRLHVKDSISILFLFLLLTLEFSHTNLTGLGTSLSTLGESGFGLRIRNNNICFRLDILLIFRLCTKFTFIWKFCLDFCVVSSNDNGKTPDELEHI